MTRQAGYSPVSFEISREDRALVDAIVLRAIDIAKSWDIPTPSRMDLTMDLVATHANGCPMDFPKLLAARDGDFMHDISGIGHHIDRRTGQLGDCFLPRCAAPQQVAR